MLNAPLDERAEWTIARRAQAARVLASFLLMLVTLMMMQQNAGIEVDESNPPQHLRSRKPTQRPSYVENVPWMTDSFLHDWGNVVYFDSRLSKNLLDPFRDVLANRRKPEKPNRGPVSATYEIRRNHSSVILDRSLMLATSVHRDRATTKNLSFLTSLKNSTQHVISAGRYPIAAGLLPSIKGIPSLWCSTRMSTDGMKESSPAEDPVDADCLVGISEVEDLHCQQLFLDGDGGGCPERQCHAVVAGYTVASAAIKGPPFCLADATSAVVVPTRDQLFVLFAQEVASPADNMDGLLNPNPAWTRKVYCLETFSPNGRKAEAPPIAGSLDCAALPEPEDIPLLREPPIALMHDEVTRSLVVLRLDRRGNLLITSLDAGRSHQKNLKNTVRYSLHMKGMKSGWVLHSDVTSGQLLLLGDSAPFFSMVTVVDLRSGKEATLPLGIHFLKT